MKKLPLIVVLAIVCIASVVHSQVDTIRLKNPSFEDEPGYNQCPLQWSNCGFTDETPPDVQPFQSISAQWGQRLAADDGATYLGLVVRDNDTYERVGQQLSSSLLADKCYAFSISLSTSNNYMSQTRATGAMGNFIEPAVFKIFGGNGRCDRGELLAVSDVVTNNKWDRYDFTFRPTQNYTWIMLEAHHKTPVLFPYNGNILVDNASPIVSITCPEDIDLIAAEDKVDPESPNRPVVVTKATPKRNSSPKTVTVAKVEPQRPDRPVIPRPKQRILTHLNRDELTAGHAIRIDQLFFAADTAAIDSQSIPVLEEIAYFLSINEDIMVEVGGHTNNRPADAFCDTLSTRRARSVAFYLYDRGIPKDQVSYMGYGKRKPVASNVTSWGRQRNQRVEIKIISPSRG